MKKKLGILGGMGSRAGAMLFSKVIDFSPAVRDQDFIEILLHNNAAVPDRTKSIVYGEASPLKDILRSIELFNENGVDVVIMGCVTAHYFYKEIQQASQAEVLHPIDLVREHLRAAYPGIQKAGVLATTGTLQSGLFQQGFKDSGIELVTLNKKEQESLFMVSVYMPEGLKSSQVSPKALELFFRTIPSLLDQGAEVIIGGCSEVQIALKNTTLPVPYVDSMDILAQAAVRVCYGMDEYSELEETSRSLYK